MKRSFMVFRFILLLSASLVASSCTIKAPQKRDPQFAHSYSGDNGTLEIGGPYIGAEFHRSRAVPSRVSFYKPVANSLDPSTDYWKRDQFVALHLEVAREGSGESVTSLLDTLAFDYTWTPADARFNGVAAGLPMDVSYAFGDSLPFMELSIRLVNTKPDTQSIRLDLSFDPTLKTSHTYASVMPDYRVDHVPMSRDVYLPYRSDEAGYAVLMVADLERRVGGDGFVFSYGEGRPVQGWLEREIAPGDTLSTSLLIGTDIQEWMDLYRRDWFEGWEEDREEYAARISRVATHDPAYLHRRESYSQTFFLSDPDLIETLYWSRGVIEATQHYLDGEIVPMPCPAQYNFYFAHDVLVTDLGVVRYDVERVEKDLRFLQKISSDTLLAHAYYWKDDRYVTEFCQHDSWNHFWFIQLAASFLRHGGDPELIRSMVPLLEASHRAIESQLGSEDNLAYGIRPDWWDLGTVPGARAYLTSHLVRAEQEFEAIQFMLGEPISPPKRRLSAIRHDLANKLWSEENGYLMNTIEDTIDHHLYSGSLLAVAYGLLDSAKANRLVDTAADVLLDEQLGIRNAMPPDFHLLEKEYRFNGPEAGGPWLYMNGAVWPQGNAWYALAQLAVNRPDDALTTLRRYLTLAGIAASPNGLPAFYEFRHTDASAPEYGRIEKPTFLWHGGWYIHCLYALAGLRETPWNLALSTDLPKVLQNGGFEVTTDGLTKVSYRGEGKTASKILWNGQPAHALVIYGTPGSIDVELGPPTEPYLESIDGMVRSLRLEEDGITLRAAVQFIAQDREAKATYVSPTHCLSTELDGVELRFSSEVIPGGFRTTVALGEIDMKALRELTPAGAWALELNFAGR
ncbi:hypothetical protein KQI63_06655 [bacterium]|nr:hypothetical protein [bacterium]